MALLVYLAAAKEKWTMGFRRWEHGQELDRGRTWSA